MEQGKCGIRRSERTFQIRDMRDESLDRKLHNNFTFYSQNFILLTMKNSMVYLYNSKILRLFRLSVSYLIGLCI